MKVVLCVCTCAVLKSMEAIWPQSSTTDLKRPPENRASAHCGRLNSPHTALTHIQCFLRLILVSQNQTCLQVAYSWGESSLELLNARVQVESRVAGRDVKSSRKSNQYIMSKTRWNCIILGPYIFIQCSSWAHFWGHCTLLVLSCALPDLQRPARI